MEYGLTALLLNPSALLITFLFLSTGRQCTSCDVATLVIETNGFLLPWPKNTDFIKYYIVDFRQTVMLLQQTSDWADKSVVKLPSNLISVGFVAVYRMLSSFMGHFPSAKITSALSHYNHTFQSSFGEQRVDWLNVETISFQFLSFGLFPRDWNDSLSLKFSFVGLSDKQWCLVLCIPTA